jgi:hypothetical protein
MGTKSKSALRTGVAPAEFGVEGTPFLCTKGETATTRKNPSGRAGVRLAFCAALGAAAVVALAPGAPEKSSAPPAIGATDCSDPGSTLNMTPKENEIKDMDLYCRLQPHELREREQTLLAELSKRTIAATPLKDGYSLSLRPDDASIRLIADIVAAERKCCPFLQFQVTAIQDSQALFLEMRGPKGSREIIADLFRLSVPEASASQRISTQ